VNAARRSGVVDFWCAVEKKIEERARRRSSISVERFMREEGGGVGRGECGSGRRRDLVVSSRSGERERGRRVA